MHIWLYQQQLAQLVFSVIHVSAAGAYIAEWNNFTVQQSALLACDSEPLRTNAATWNADLSKKGREKNIACAEAIILACRTGMSVTNKNLIT
jgi:hypothetical protein